jgi:hypothetical protein
MVKRQKRRGRLIPKLVAIVVGTDDLLALFVPVGGIGLDRRCFPIRRGRFGSGLLRLLDGIDDRSLDGKSVAIVHDAPGHIVWFYTSPLMGICFRP